MNSIIEDVYPLFELYQDMRSQMMELLVDADLDFSPGVGNLKLGAICREIGETEYSYIQSFKDFKQDFSYKIEDPELEGSVDWLKEWYRNLDQDLRQAVEALTEEDISDRLIEREPNFKVPPRIQLEIYKEALLIFYGKSSVYLKAMGKEMPQQWQHWIA